MFLELQALYGTESGFGPAQSSLKFFIRTHRASNFSLHLTHIFCFRDFLERFYDFLNFSDKRLEFIEYFPTSCSLSYFLICTVSLYQVSLLSCCPSSVLTNK